jgi:hypothetical protein
MKKVLLAAAALACIGGAAHAGVNANGSLIVVLADGVVYTDGITDYCGATGLQSCGDAIVRTDGIEETVVFGVLGAFPPIASPRVKGVVFGWAYDANEIKLVTYGSCGDFELPTADWPASGEGTAVTWGDAQTSTLLDIYWGAAYSYYGNPTTIDMGVHPTQPAEFADDSIPAVTDPIAAFGSLGFSTDGNLPCPVDVADGACCFADGSCVVVSRDDCAAGGGEFLGDGVACDPNPCPVPLTGACCIGELCSIRTADECADSDGDYQGDDSVCDPNPCEIPSPTIETSWGTLKGIYR